MAYTCKYGARLADGKCPKKPKSVKNTPPPKKTKSALSINMIYGVVSLIIALLCHVSKLAPSVWFNHIDVSHIFMTASMYFMYRGAASFRPREEMEHV